ncbi:MAG: hypothetical protein HDQ96_14435 [Lachnospiraceae bacterium]|nr:hypothetical protein [Lachnospiraceae bacterium]
MPSEKEIYDETMPSEEEIFDETVSDEKELPVELIFDSSADTSSKIGEEDINMPEIEKHSSSVEVTIRNSEEYKVFINMLNDFRDYSILELDMSGTSTTVFLDEIIAGSNFTYFEITNGGIIAIKNKDDLKDYPLKTLELYNVFEIEENLINQVSVSWLLVFELGDNYAGSAPIKELLDETDCEMITILSDKKAEGGLHYGEESYADMSGKEDSLCQVPYVEEGILRGIYRQNKSDYSYTSYEFYKPESEKEICAVYIGVDYRGGDDKKCIAMVQVPQNRYSDIRRTDVYGKIMVEDVNFDGYEDICFSGNDDYLNGDDLCCIFLWNEQEKRYKICDTAPRHIRHVDSEKKRLTHTITYGVSWDEYYIYEYRNGTYHEKKLENRFFLEEHDEDGNAIDKIIWNYSEDGELKETLEYIFNENGNTSHIIYQGKGRTEEEVFEGKKDYDEVGKKYFPEFDFYWKG